MHNLLGLLGMNCMGEVLTLYLNQILVFLSSFKEICFVKYQEKKCCLTFIFTDLK